MTDTPRTPSAPSQVNHFDIIDLTQEPLSPNMPSSPSMPGPVTHLDLTYESLSSDVSPVPSTLSQRFDVIDLTYEEDSDPRIKYPGIKYTNTGIGYTSERDPVYIPRPSTPGPGSIWKTCVQPRPR
jgi:hypothetical protein